MKILKGGLTTMEIIAPKIADGLLIKNKPIIEEIVCG